jgi:hypothetical protein
MENLVFKVNSFFELEKFEPIYKSVKKTDSFLSYLGLNGVWFALFMLLFRTLTSPNTLIHSNITVVIYRILHHTRTEPYLTLAIFLYRFTYRTVFFTFTLQQSKSDGFSILYFFTTVEL